MLNQFRRHMAMRITLKFPWLKRALFGIRYGLYTPERIVRSRLTKDQDICARLKIYGRKTYSQNDEDGILDYLFSRISPRERYFVEIGVGPPWGATDLEAEAETGLECNCRLLAEGGWSGVYIDGGQHLPELDVKQEFVTAENINQILVKYSVPKNFDLLSVDIDGNDYWIWAALQYRPSVVVIEYNASIPASESKTIPYDPNFSWTESGGGAYFGSSLLALKRLADRKGYSLVYSNGVNAFFVDSDLFLNSGDFEYDRVYVHKSRHPKMRGDEVWQHV